MIELGTRVVYRSDILPDIDPSERNDVGTVNEIEPTRVQVKWDSGWVLWEYGCELVAEGSGK